MTEPNPLLKVALDYARQGWPIFPCKPENALRLSNGKADKSPLTKNGVLDATTDPRQISKWWAITPDANIGLDVGGAGMMVLDLDPGHSIKELEKNVGQILSTSLRTRTPRGGFHLYFALANEEHVSCSSSKIASHVDVRSFHGYVLLPPSATKDGSYIWEANGKPAYRTNEMVRVANSAREKSEDRNTWIIEPDLQKNVECASNWLKHEAKIAIEGQGGDHCAYATAAMMKSYAISEEKAFDLMVEHWDQRCKPSWASVDELDHLRTKVKNAYRHNTSPPGNQTKGYSLALKKLLFPPKETSRLNLRRAPNDKVARFRFVDREGMDHIQPPTWIVNDLITEDSYVILFGPFSTFKTFIALDLALSIASGIVIDPIWKIDTMGPVLFAAGESRSNIIQRVRGWEKVHFGGHKVKNFILVDPVPTTITGEDDLKAFAEEALSYHPEGYQCVIIDTIGRAMQGADENSQKDASRMTELVKWINHEIGRSVLALHHSGLQEESRLRGSSVFAADADTVVRLSRRGKAMGVTLTMAKPHKDAPEWKSEKRIKLTKVNLSLGHTTVVAVSAPPLTPEEIKATKATLEGDQLLVLAIIDKEIKAILRANKMKSWNQKNLAEAVAMKESIVGISSSQLAGKYFPSVRELNGMFSNRAYDPERSQKAGRWHWPSESD